MKNIIFASVCVLTITACTTIPSGPSAMALPGTGKSFEQFRYDDDNCQQYSLQRSGLSASDAGNDSMAKSAIVGTVIGAALGAAVGGSGGAAIGAGTGLFVGTAEGSNAAAVSSGIAQQRYDNAYTQCMYAKGNRVPVSGNFSTQYQRSTPAPALNTMSNTAPPSQYYYPPPPPPGYVK